MNRLPFGIQKHVDKFSRLDQSTCLLKNYAIYSRLDENAFVGDKIFFYCSMLKQFVGKYNKLITLYFFVEEMSSIKQT